MPNFNKPTSELMEELRQQRGGQCVFWPCGKRNGLEFAHVADTEVIGRGRGSRQRYYDIKRNPQCYVLLCRHHHAIVDGGFGSRVRKKPSPLRYEDLRYEDLRYEDGQRVPEDAPF